MTTNEMAAALARTGRSENSPIHEDSRRVLKLATAALPILKGEEDKGSIAILLYADELKLYGAKASTLHNSCGRDIEITATVIYGWQQGLVKARDIQQALRDMERHQTHSLNISNIVWNVASTIPNYNIPFYVPPFHPLNIAKKFPSRGGGNNNNKGPGG